VSRFHSVVLALQAGVPFIAADPYWHPGTATSKVHQLLASLGSTGRHWTGTPADAGADGARTMMLVYNLPRTAAIFDRFGGLDGSAYFIGGFGMTALTANNIVLVPIRSGVGLRLGANLGYLKFTDRPTWNPF